MPIDPGEGPDRSSAPESGGDFRLSADERARLDAIRTAANLADLQEFTGAESEHEAYFAAKEEWFDLREKELAETSCDDVLVALPDGDPDVEAGPGIPGARVDIDGHTFWVHGITHAGTEAEREFVRAHVSRFVDAGATVYCEQGIRGMYLANVPEVCEMDDYNWALARCDDLYVSPPSEFGDVEFEGLVEDVTSLASRFREAAFSLIDSGRTVYGEQFAMALGDVASDFLMSHEEFSTGEDFTSFSIAREAARNPRKLGDLQRYYEQSFLPSPLEREWLRRHDHHLETVTHARNERIAEYAVYHNREVERVHLIVGAAHQPGVRYYLERFRDGRPRPGNLELFL